MNTVDPLGGHARSARSARLVPLVAGVILVVEFAGSMDILSVGHDDHPAIGEARKRGCVRHAQQRWSIDQDEVVLRCDLLKELCRCRR